MKKAVLNTLILVCICGVMALLLAVTNLITAPIIQANQEKKALESLKVVMPDGEFDADAQIDLKDKGLPEYVTAAYQEKNGGYVIQVKTAGYGSDLIIMCGVNAEGVVTGAVCLSSSETLGHEKTYGEKFIGKNEEGVEDVAIVSGATLTTSAYKTAIADALKIAALLRGEDVDVRTHEEKLQDALPAAEGKFTRLFIVEVIEGIDAVYTADNGKGSVYVVGEHYIPVDENGGIPVFDSISPEIQQNVAAADVILSATTTEVIDQTAYGEELKYITSAKKTATGNYILEVKGPGYGIVGGDDYHPASGEYIIVRVSMTPDGKIIDTFTVSQAETAGVGDACAKEEFYGQFDGKTESDYKDIDAIGGATMTTSGYLKAIERAFAAVKILEGGSN